MTKIIRSSGSHQCVSQKDPPPLSGCKFGEQSLNTPPASFATEARTTVLPDGHSSFATDCMHREEKRYPGRREPSFPGLHNLHESVFERTLRPPEPCEEEHKWRKMLWDLSAHALREALGDIPAGSHINICANSGPYDPKFEDLPPWATVPGATVDLMIVAEFRDEKATGIHPGWRQVAHPIRADEGRLLAGLRLLATARTSINVFPKHC